MSKMYHLCLDIRGALLNWNDREMRGVLQHDDGRPMNAREAKNALMDEIAKGRKVIPCSPCDNFDYQRGCQGHEEPDDQPAPPRDCSACGKPLPPTDHPFPSGYCWECVSTKTMDQLGRESNSRKV
jgi:hypothetical protein